MSTKIDILKPIREAIKECSARIYSLEVLNRRLQAENKKLKKNASDVVITELRSEIASLKEQLKLSYGQFGSEKELNAYKEFERKHIHNRATSKAESGKAPYVIAYGTGIGTCFTVVCPICGEKQDITDTSCW